MKPTGMELHRDLISGKTRVILELDGDPDEAEKILLMQIQYCSDVSDQMLKLAKLLYDISVVHTKLLYDTKQLRGLGSTRMVVQFHPLSEL